LGPGRLGGLGATAVAVLRVVAAGEWRSARQGGLRSMTMGAKERGGGDGSYSGSNRAWGPCRESSGEDRRWNRGGVRGGIRRSASRGFWSRWLDAVGPGGAGGRDGAAGAAPEAAIRSKLCSGRAWRGGGAGVYAGPAGWDGGAGGAAGFKKGKPGISGGVLARGLAGDLGRRSRRGVTHTRRVREEGEGADRWGPGAARRGERDAGRWDRGERQRRARATRCGVNGLRR